MARRIATKVDIVNWTSEGGLGEATNGVHQECLYSAQDTSNNSTTIYNAPCIYLGAVVTTALSAHVVLIKDGSNVIDAFPASAAIGTNHDFGGVRCETSLVIDPDDSSTGNMTVFYKPL